MSEEVPRTEVGFGDGKTTLAFSGEGIVLGMYEESSSSVKRGCSLQNPSSDTFYFTKVIRQRQPVLLLCPLKKRVLQKSMRGFQTL